MSKLSVSAGAILGIVVFTSPCVGQNAPWPPPAGMSAGDYLQRYGRMYNPYTGGDPRREDRERYRQLPELPKPYTPPSPSVGTNPYAVVRPEYNPKTGVYELPCPAAARSDPSAGQRREYNVYTGKYELPCSTRQ